MKEIILTRGYVALVDDEDFDRVSRCKWTSNPQSHTVYARRNFQGHTQMLHRFILEAKPGQLVDHIDRNGLNNTRQNLRFSTPALNNINTAARSATGFKGVRQTGVSSFSANIRYQGTLHRLGVFETVELAARAYDLACLHFYGSYARLNFPSTSPTSPEPTPSVGTGLFTVPQMVFL